MADHAMSVVTGAAAAGKFAEYKRRAEGRTKAPIVYGVEEGFDPPITITQPDPERFDRLNRASFDKDKLRILVDGDTDVEGGDFDRLWAVIGTWPMPAFKELVDDIFGHFFRAGGA